MSNSVTFEKLLPRIKKSVPVIISLSVIGTAITALIILGPILKHTVDKSNHIIKIALKFADEHGGYFRIVHDPALLKQFEILSYNPYAGAATGETFATMGLCAVVIGGGIVAGLAIKNLCLEIKNGQTKDQVAKDFASQGDQDL